MASTLLSQLYFFAVLIEFFWIVLVLSFFDNIVDKLRNDLEDLATQIFTRKPGGFSV